MGGRQAFGGAIGATAANPTAATVGVPTTVTITSVITDPSLIAGSVNLQSLNSSNQVVAVIGLLHDDGLNGDAVAGDHIYTIQTTVYETAPGPQSVRVSAAFQGSLARSYSAPVAVNVTGTGIGINIM